MKRSLDVTNQFKKDLKHELSSDPSVEDEVKQVIALLVNDHALPAALHDHKLKGPWKGHRDCHVRPDLVLIYKKPEGELRLVRLGSHSELFKR